MILASMANSASSKSVLIIVPLTVLATSIRAIAHATKTILAMIAASIATIKRAVLMVNATALENAFVSLLGSDRLATFIATQRFHATVKARAIHKELATVTRLTTETTASTFNALVLAR